MKTVESTDGTEIAYDVAGSGPSLVLVGGAFNNRYSWGRLTPLLTDSFEVYTYDRRGRGDSGSGTNSPASEMDDLDAVLYAAGGAANVFGHSSGAILALETAARGTGGIRRLAVYEPPFTPDDDPTMMSDVLAALAAGDTDAAAERFLSSTGAPVEWMKTQPWWAGMAATATTLPNEFALAVADVPVERYAAIAVPTLVMNGAASPRWAPAATSAVSRAVSGAQTRELAGQDHNPADELLAQALTEFFAQQSS
jgi:pimeloyl-ACP methyl ester carboxylesterase